MRLRWGEEKFRGFSNPVKKVEAINDWAWWAIFGTVIVMEIIFILKMMERI